MGEPEDDPLAVDGAFRFPALTLGQVLVALQPERGDLSVAMQTITTSRAACGTPMSPSTCGWASRVRMRWSSAGAHGTLEWLPGKAVALSDACWPEALTQAMPVIYPFIVNDPGEAAQAKRRIGAVTIGHVPPPRPDRKRRRAGPDRGFAGRPMPTGWTLPAGTVCRNPSARKLPRWGWRQSSALIPPPLWSKRSPGSIASSRCESQPVR